jgi:hypothetical protein
VLAQRRGQAVSHEQPGQDPSGDHPQRRERLRRRPLQLLQNFCGAAPADVVVAGRPARFPLPSVLIMKSTSVAPVQSPPAAPGAGFARRRPIVAFLLGAYGLGWPLLTIATVTDQQRGPVG